MGDNNEDPVEQVSYGDFGREFFERGVMVLIDIASRGPSPTVEHLHEDLQEAIAMEIEESSQPTAAGEAAQ